ncbi:hypothetical protein NM688_g3448 [Phlebia brevispora]|uniref:Uncharacterized protein n=1 Tax=Phlebia brevispora TaxID=194682 RepID=A0ACC1T646_9APHY|nr:hypothetical protein NM688_g3448 [Phlebia brevispora]
MIAYNGAWGDSSHADPEWFDYTNGTFHATQEEGATAYLTFNGSAVYVIGARRTNHGKYSATLDGSTTVYNGDVSVDQFNCTLYSQTSLAAGQHDLILENQWTGENPTWFDIDYMIITSGDGNPATQSSETTLDDSAASNITYTSGWESSPNGFEQYYYMSTMHRTNIQGASANILFYGNAITLYGATSNNHGLFSITLDGIPISYTLNGSAPVNQTRWQNMLYYSGGLSSSLHNMTVAHADPDTSKYFDLDKVVVSQWPEAQALDLDPSSSLQPVVPSVPPSSSNTGASKSSTQPVKKGLIAGAVILAIVVAILLGVIVLLVVGRRRRLQHTDSEEAAVPGIEDLGPATMWQIEPFHTAGQTDKRHEHEPKREPGREDHECDDRDDLPFSAPEQPVKPSAMMLSAHIVTSPRRIQPPRALFSDARSLRTPGLPPPAYSEITAVMLQDENVFDVAELPPA